MLLVEQLTEPPQEGLFICILHSILLMHNKTITSVQHFQPDFSLFSFSFLFPYFLVVQTHFPIPIPYGCTGRTDQEAFRQPLRREAL